jgi:phosphatidylglycerophosphatase A
MITEQKIIENGANLFLKGESIFQLEKFLEQNRVEADEKNIFIDEILTYAAVIQKKKEVRLKKFKLLFTSIILTILITLFVLGILGFIGIGLIATLLIFWFLQSAKILGPNQQHKRRFTRR